MADEMKEGAEPEATNPADVAKQWLESDEGKAWLQPTLDRTVAKALKTHDEKRAPEIERMLEEAKSKAAQEANMTAEERWQAKANETAQKLDTLERQLAKERRDSTFLKYAESKKLPAEYVDTILGNPVYDEEAGKEAIDRIAARYEADVTTKVNEAIVSQSHKPGSGSTGDGKEELDYSTLSWSNDEDRKVLLADAEKRLST